MVVNQQSPPKSKTELAKELGISRQSLYYKPKLPEKDLKLKAEIEKVMADNKAYGHRRVAWALNINKKRARRVMKLYGLKPQRKRRKSPVKPKAQSNSNSKYVQISKRILLKRVRQKWKQAY